MSKFLISILKEERENGRTPDSIKYKKDCPDFVCLEDGTITKEYKYCNLSLQCRQVDIVTNCETFPMEANYLPVYDAKGHLHSHELFCTGMHDIRSYIERLEDDRVS